MAFRILTYAVFYWEKCFHDWEKSPTASREKFRFRPIVPIVFHASSGRWKGAKTFQELLGEPSAFHAFAPVWNPLFWEVGARDADELLANEDAFMQVLAIVRAEDAERTEAMRVYREFMRRVGELRSSNKLRWLAMVRFAMMWVVHRRAPEERAEWIRATEESQNDLLSREEVRNMKDTIAHSWLQEGIQIGDAQGMEKGVRSMILRLGRRRFGDPTDAQRAALEAITDIGRLENLGDAVSDSASWDDLLRLG